MSSALGTGDTNDEIQTELSAFGSLHFGEREAIGEMPSLSGSGIPKGNNKERRMKGVGRNRESQFF